MWTSLPSKTQKLSRKRMSKKRKKRLGQLIYHHRYKIVSVPILWCPSNMMRRMPVKNSRWSSKRPEPGSSFRGKRRMCFNHFKKGPLSKMCHDLSLNFKMTQTRWKQIFSRFSSRLIIKISTTPKFSILNAIMTRLIEYIRYSFICQAMLPSWISRRISSSKSSNLIA